MSAAARSLVYGQVAFFCFLFLCMLVSGEGLGHNHGPSFYGSNDRTFILYALGFAFSAFFFGRAAVLLERTGGPVDRRLATGLRVLIVLLLLDLSTPDTVSHAFYDAHIASSVALFLFELSFGLWVAARMTRSLGGWAMLGTQFAGGVFAGLSQVHAIALLGESILVFQLAFGTLLVTATAPRGAEASAQPERAASTSST